jgi:hypothetical protein
MSNSILNFTAQLRNPRGTREIKLSVSRFFNYVFSDAIMILWSLRFISK